MSEVTESTMAALRKTTNQESYKKNLDKKLSKKTPVSKGTAEERRKQLEADTAAFLKQGGEVIDIPVGTTGMEPTGNKRVGIVISGKKDASQSILQKKD